MRNMSAEYKKYHYKGPVYRFGYVHCESYEAWTSAPTGKRAMSNLLQRYKLMNGFQPGSKFDLEPLCLKEEE